MRDAVSGRITVTLETQPVCGLVQEAVVGAAMWLVAANAAMPFGDKRAGRLMLESVRAALLGVTGEAVDVATMPEAGSAGAGEVMAGDAGDVPVGHRMTGAQTKLTDGINMALAAEVALRIAEHLVGAGVNTVTTDAVDVQSHMGIETDCPGLGVWLMAAGTDAVDLMHGHELRPADILRHGVIDVLGAARVAAYAADCHAGVVDLRAQPMRRGCQIGVIAIVTHKACFIIDLKLNGTIQKRTRRTEQRQRQKHGCRSSGS
jgi:hypothetical protein